MRKLVRFDREFFQRRREREVYRTINSLCERGYISVRGVKDGSPTYDVHWDRVLAALNTPSSLKGSL